ncbi:MAG: DUF5940 domain-containing protein [Hymenobacter sp.]
MKFQGHLRHELPVHGGRAGRHGGPGRGRRRRHRPAIRLDVVGPPPGVRRRLGAPDHGGPGRGAARALGIGHDRRRRLRHRAAQPRDHRAPGVRQRPRAQLPHHRRPGRQPGATSTAGRASRRFVAERGMPGFAPTQGHLASALCYLPHALDRLTTGDAGRVLLLGQGQPVPGPHVPAVRRDERAARTKCPSLNDRGGEAQHAAREEGGRGRRAGRHLRPSHRRLRRRRPGPQVVFVATECFV